jgi:hypothetical protein
MAKNYKPKERQIGGKKVSPKGLNSTRKPLINPKYKNLLSTIIIIVILLIFFIVNNTRKEPDRGPYPPFYKSNKINLSSDGTSEKTPQQDNR